MAESSRPAATPIHRDQTRVYESEPQTQHKVQLMGTYYGQYPRILIGAAQSNPKIDASHIWLIEACAGAGLYASGEHADGAVPGCALQACMRAREVQREHASVTMHVVLIEPNPTYCAELNELARPFIEATGRDRVDVRIEPEPFEAIAQSVLERTRKPNGTYYHSLWFVDPDGVTPIPHKVISEIIEAGRGPEIIINLSASGLARIRQGAIPKPGVTPHAALSGQQRRMDIVFGGRGWLKLAEAPSWDVEVYRVADAYAKSFPNIKSDVHMLRTRGDEIRYFVHLSHSSKALYKLDKTYQASQRTGLLRGEKLTDAEKNRYALQWFESMRGTTVTAEAIFKALAGRLSRSQVRWVLQYASNNDYGVFHERESSMEWNLERKPRKLKTPLALAKDEKRQPSLFDV